MISPMFEIKVALLGHVSVGKTTVLNALCQEQFSEVSMKRTTAGINQFRISSTSKSAKKSKLADDDGVIELDSSISSISNEAHVTAKQTLAEIIEDNKVLRQSKKIQEKTFDVELDESLVDMRKDTRLVLVDIPGINEAHTHQLYLDYVKGSWDGFDCVIVVIDANSGANTEEQVNLLRLVKQHTDEIKDIPVIVLCNKVDNPNNKEVMGLVSEVRQEVERIFEVNDRKKALVQALAGKRYHGKQQASPCFIPVSAENAFLYRLVSRVHFGDYKRLDRAYLEKIGHKECGENMWPELSEQEQHDLVFKVVSDPKKYKSRIEKSNFDKVLKVLDFFLGGDTKQEEIIEKQLHVALKKLSIGDGSGIATNLSKIYDRGTALRKPTSHLKEKFWALYEEAKDQALETIIEDVKEVSSLHTPMAELVQYASTLHLKIHMLSTDMTGKEDDYAKIIQEMKALIRRQYQVVFEKEAEWTLRDPDPPKVNNDSYSYPDSWQWQGNGNGWYNSYSGQSNYNPKHQHPAGNLPKHWQWNESTKIWKNKYTEEERCGSRNENPATIPISKEAVTWNSLAPHDWNTIISSMLLVSGEKCFYQNFGKEMADLAWLSRTGTFAQVEQMCSTCRSFTCGHVPVGKKYLQYMKGTYENGVFVPNNKVNYDRAVQIVMPESLSDSAHWGHLGWMFCEFMQSSE